jgi:membrane-associated HD superfamily phosphohydrolase
MKYIFLFITIAFIAIIILFYQEMIGTKWYINQWGTYLLSVPTVFCLLMFYNQPYYSCNKSWIKWFTGGIIINVLLLTADPNIFTLYKTLSTLAGSIMTYFAANLIQKRVES